MSLTSTQKKVIGITVVILLGIIELFFVFSLLFVVISDRPTIEGGSMSTWFVIGLFLFPLMWGFRLWRTGLREISRERLDESAAGVDANTVVKLQVKVELSEYRKLNFQMTYTKALFLYIHFIAISMVLLSWPHLRESWFGLFALLFMIFLPISIYRSTNSNYKSTKALHEVIFYEFSPEGFTATGDSFTSTSQWTLFHKFRETKQWMLLYTNKQVAMLIPKRAFASAEEMDAFRRMARVVPV